VRAGIAAIPVFDADWLVGELARHRIGLEGGFGSDPLQRTAAASRTCRLFVGGHDASTFCHGIGQQSQRNTGAMAASIGMIHHGSVAITLGILWRISLRLDDHVPSGLDEMSQIFRITAGFSFRQIAADHDTPIVGLAPNDNSIWHFCTLRAVDERPSEVHWNSNAFLVPAESERNTSARNTCGPPAVRRGESGRTPDD
jgi:hypothetical protein